MKKAAKVFIILGMVIRFYMIYPLVIGSLALKKIDNAKDTSELTVWGVVCLFLVSILGGLFTICIKQEELGPKPVTNTYADVEVPEPSPDDDDTIRQLKLLKASYLRGQIDRKTYEEKRQKYAEVLFDRLSKLKLLLDEHVITEFEYNKQKEEFFELLK